MLFVPAVRHIPEGMLLSSAPKIKSPSIPLVKLISLWLLIVGWHTDIWNLPTDMERDRIARFVIDDETAANLYCRRVHRVGRRAGLLRNPCPGSVKNSGTLKKLCGVSVVGRGGKGTLFQKRPLPSPLTRFF